VISLSDTAFKHRGTAYYPVGFSLMALCAALGYGEAQPQRLGACTHPRADLP